MLTIDADETRYLATAAPGDVPGVRRIPGHRYHPQQRRWTLPRQAGAVLALDRVFGTGGWTASEDLALEVEEARGRDYGSAQNDARVELDGAQLAVSCSIADKELVKLVPGYRWSPAQRCWFVPAFPLALEILRERFGPLLVVSEAVETFISLRRIDEDRSAERLVHAATARTEPPPTVVGTDRNGSAPSVDQADEAPLALQVERLAAAVDRLTAMIEVLAGAAPGAVGSGDQPAQEDHNAEPPPAGAEPAATDDVRELLDLAGNRPDASLERANRLLQTSEAGSDADVRAVAGVAAAGAGDFDQALTHLRRSLGRTDGATDADVTSAANDAYLRAVFGLLTAECGPESPIASADDFREALLGELAKDAGFRDEMIGSKAARDRLEFLVNDPVLRRISPGVSGYCRIAHLLGIARSGTWMAAERVADVLRDATLPDDSFAFAAILFANVLLKEKCVEEWIGQWPRADEETLEADVRLLISRAGQLERVEPGLAADAALSCLVVLAQAPSDCATLAQRRALVRLVTPNMPGRRYAEFLAAFPLASLGQRAVVSHFPGYIQTLQMQTLTRMAPHLLDVFVQDSGGPGSLSRAIAENVIVPALRTGGVSDPATQVIDLLDVLVESPKADNLLNELAATIEDGAFPGADRFSRDQRKTVYRRALKESLEAGHDQDMRQAFDRLVRELQDEGARTELRTLASRLQAGPKPLRIACLVLLLEALLEDGAPFEETLEHLVAANNARTPNDPDDPVAELEGVALVYPQVDLPLRTLLERRGIEPTTEKNFPDITGKRLVVVGGHEWLKKQSLPVLADTWKLRVDWLDPADSQERRPVARPGIGRRRPDRSLTRAASVMQRVGASWKRRRRAASP